MVRDDPRHAPGHRRAGPAQAHARRYPGKPVTSAHVVAHVSAPAFEGPCDVLLSLISDHKLDIYDIPLADIVDGFLAELAALETLDLQVTTEFLVIAAILVELKSRKLLPGPDEVDDDEELSGFEERDRLLARLLELQAYAAAADAFCLLIEQAARSVPRTAGLDEEFRELAPDLLAGITPDRLAAAFLLGSTPRPELVLDLSHVTVEAVTVSEAVDELERKPARGRHHELPHPHRPLLDPDAGHRALPGPAGVVQAGLDLPSTRARPSGTWPSPGRPRPTPCRWWERATVSRSTTAEQRRHG